MGTFTTKAQHKVFRILNQVDSTPIVFARVTINSQEYITDNEGVFKFPINSIDDNMDLRIKHVSCNINSIISLKTTSFNTIYLACGNKTLKQFNVKNTSAKSIILRAIDSIGSCFYDSNYVANTHYINYQKINNRICNEVEAKFYTLYNLQKVKNTLSPTSINFAIDSLNVQNKFNCEIEADEDLLNVFLQNPIYFLSKGMLNKKIIDNYTFNFDTVLSNDLVYVINYQNKKFTTDNHGIANYFESGLSEEGIESGKLYIDRKTFGIHRVERDAFRNNGYLYTNNNNFLLPNRKFYIEFVSGKLVIYFNYFNHKLVVQNLFYSYTNNYFRSAIGGDASYTITNFYEVVNTNTSRTISNFFIDKFESKPKFYFSENRYPFLKGRTDYKNYFFKEFYK